MAREMKDSGVPWIGKIPADWSKDKVIRLFDIIGSGTTPKSADESNFCGEINWIQSGDINGGYIDRSKNKVSQDVVEKYSALKIYEAPFIVIAMYGASIGNISISRIDGCVNQACCALCGSNLDFKYAFYAIQATKDYLIQKGIGGGQPNISQEIIKQLWLPVPKLEEQNRIANFLDHRCAEIDIVLEKTLLSIEEYKKLKQATITQAVTKGIRGDRPMKDSGIEWVGIVPSDWNVTRFSHLATVKSNLVSPQDYLDFPQVSPENIEKGNAKLLPCKTVSESGVISGNHLFFEGQILYSKIRPKLNKVCIAPFSGLCSADMYPIETTYNTKFVVYIMLSDLFVGQVSMITEDRVKMPKINQDELGSLVVTYPIDEAEQQEIVEYLDLKCAEIDALIGQKEKMLAELGAYKKSLIYEYATGKKEI